MTLDAEPGPHPTPDPPQGYCELLFELAKAYEEDDPVLSPLHRIASEGVDAEPTSGAEDEEKGADDETDDVRLRETRDILRRKLARCEWHRPNVKGKLF